MHAASEWLRGAYCYAPDHRNIHAVQITFDDYAQYDFVIGMDGENMADLRRLTHGDPQGKTCRLMEFAGESRDVADPWYTDDFEATYRDVLKGCRALLKKLQEDGKCN